MYRGNNVTAIQSQRWLRDALIDLMHEKAYPSNLFTHVTA